jgi:hypothetical protein
MKGREKPVFFYIFRHNVRSSNTGFYFFKKMHFNKF